MACGGAVVYRSDGDEGAGRHARPYRDFHAARRIAGADAGDCPAFAKYAAAPPVWPVYLVLPRNTAAGAAAVLVQHVDAVPARGPWYSLRPGVHELEHQ